MAKYALTTVDNPYDPFEEFDQWFNYDTEQGYYSCGYLARIARTSDALTDEENDKEVSRAIDEIVDNDFMGIYIKATNPREKALTSV